MVSNVFRIDADGVWHFWVYMRRNSDGKIVQFENCRPPEHADAELIEFWWSEGNGHCDCNRGMDFDRACGVSEDEILDLSDEEEAARYPCGEDRYSVNIPAVGLKEF